MHTCSYHTGVSVTLLPLTVVYLLLVIENVHMHAAIVLRIHQQAVVNCAEKFIYLYPILNCLFRQNYHNIDRAKCVVNMMTQ